MWHYPPTSQKIIFQFYSEVKNFHEQVFATVRMIYTNLYTLKVLSNESNIKTMASHYVHFSQYQFLIQVG